MSTRVIITLTTIAAVCSGMSGWAASKSDTAWAVMLAAFSLLALAALFIETSNTWHIPSIGFRIQLGYLTLSWLPCYASRFGRIHEYGPITFYVL